MNLVNSFAVIQLAWACLFWGLISSAADCDAQSSTTNILISGNVLQSPVHRLGVNLGDQGYWDSGQMLKNLVFENPSFEGLKYRVILHCNSVTASTCTDDNGYNGQPTGYWANGTYMVISGAAQGTTGVIVNNKKSATSCGSCGPTIQFDKNVNMAAGDYVALTNYFPGTGDAGWWDNVSGGAVISTESTDLSPNTPGKQALLLSADKAGQSASVAQYFDSSTAMSFIQMNGTFQVTFRAKGMGGNNQLNVNVQRLQAGNGPWLSRTLSLTNSWQDYTLNFSANETGSAVGTIQLVFAVTGADVEMDDVSLAQTNSDPANTTPFRDDVVNALKQLRPGTIRMMAAGAALGSDLPNQLAVPFARYREGFNADYSSINNVAYGIHEFLQLCQAVGADPWITIPTATTPQEMTDLIEYLAGNGTDNFSASRVARGQSQPWTAVFDKIHLELGNETWNGVFKGESMVYPAYPQWANVVFGAARKVPGYQAGKFDLVLDGWGAVPGYNAAMLSYSTQHDSMDIAPYLLYSANNEPLPTMFGALFAEPEMFNSPGGEVYQNLLAANAAARKTSLSVYETNLGTELGAITQAQMNQLTPSVGAGIATADNMLQMMRNGVQYQNTFSLPQYQYKRTDGSLVKLWGIVVDMGTTNRKRPQFLTQSLVNSVIGGNMLQTVQSGSNPTWNQPLSSDGVQLSSAHSLQSFAFLNGTTISTVLFNLSQTAALPVTLSGENAPSGTVQMTQITSANITDNNETSNVVQPVTKTLSGFVATTVLSLPPFSMTVLRWTSTVTQMPQFSVPAGTYSTTQQVALSDTTPGAVIYYTTDGSAPTKTSPVYSAPIQVSASGSVKVIEAMAIAPNFTMSQVATAAYTIQPNASAPLFSVPSGTYSTAQSVSLSTTTSGAVIYYTTDGSTPTVSSKQYSGAIAVKSNETLSAIAVATNYCNSAVSTATYTIAPPAVAPVFSVAPGAYSITQYVSISDSMASANIYYTTDGSTPTVNSNQYSAAVTVSVSQTLKAIATASGYSSSPVTSASYTISNLTAQPTFTPAAGTYNGPQVVSMVDATPGAVIYYTTDGTKPTTSSAVYSGPVAVNGTENLSAIAVATGYSASKLGSALYTLQVATPQLSVPGGTYSGPQAISITTATVGANIFYTTDGSTPNTMSTQYVGPLVISSSKSLKVIGARSDYVCSGVISATYTITGGQVTATPVLSLASGTYASVQSVAITDATPGAAIYYTIDGTTPTTTSAKYSAPIVVNSTGKLEAWAVAPGMGGSGIASATYTITESLAISFANGFAASGVHLNGSAGIVGTNLQLVSGVAGQAGTAWYPDKVEVSDFATQFDFQLPASTADGFTFTLQNEGAGTWALGGNGSGLGYSGITSSVAVSFNFYQPGVANAETLSVLTGGSTATAMSVNLAGSGINLHGGDAFRAQIAYRAGGLMVTLTDKASGVTNTSAFKVDVPGIIGSTSAYAGFTGATGAATSVQNILNWTYTN